MPREPVELRLGQGAADRPRPGDRPVILNDQAATPGLVLDLAHSVQGAS